jgi:hypothetical protein
LRVVVISWAPEAAERAALFAGHDVSVVAAKRSADLRPLLESPPDVFVFDLERRPSEGRSIGVYLRQRKATRDVPLVFAGGAAEQVEKVRRLLPDAAFTTWDRIAQAVAAAETPADPVVPGTMDAYSGTALPKKLGLKDGSTVAYLRAPEGFAEQIGSPPEARPADVVLLFVRSQQELDQRLAEADAAMADGGSVWIAWPKRASGIESDLDQNSVRATGMASGLVDYKVAAIDATWSGLRFARRAQERARPRP